MSRFTPRPWLGEEQALAAGNYGHLQRAYERSLSAPDTAERPAGKASRPASAAPARPAAPRFTQQEVDQAAAKARSAERARVRAVFASEHSKGRERLCATILSASDGWSAQEIISRLPRMSDDRQFAANMARGNGAADAVWERAYAAAARESAGQPSNAKTDAVWAGAYGATDASTQEQPK